MLDEEITFTVKVQALGRVAIPKEIREALKIKEGDLVTLRIRKVSLSKSDRREGRARNVRRG